MHNQEINIYREIQRNTEMGMKAIDSISDKVFDDSLAKLIAKQSSEYAGIRNRAYDKLLEAGAEPYRSSHMENLMLTGGIYLNTLLNTSTAHIAELMIKGSNMGIVEMNKVLNHNEDALREATEMAEGLLSLEAKSMESLKKYL